jgi:hypothetical protein
LSNPPLEIVIPREKAVFRLDARGRWCNLHGIFRNRRISDYFHASIRRDEGGYFVCQQLGDTREKVYFPYEDTALFVLDVKFGPPSYLMLNTRREVLLEPENLWLAGESLYMNLDGERIKFSERAMLKLAEMMEFNADGYFIIIQGRRHQVTEMPTKNTTPHHTSKEDSHV